MVETTERKILQSYKLKSSLSEHIRQVEARILEQIAMAGNVGISHLVLAESVGIDRKNLGKYTTRLVKRKLIRKGAGKQGKYFFTSEIFDDVYMNAKFFGRLFAEKHLPKKYHLVKTKIRRKNWLVDFSFVPHLKVENKETFGLLQTMFELSSSIGAYILYVLIQAMSSENRAIRSKGKIDESFTRIWTREAITSVIDSLLPFFKLIIRNHILRYLETTDGLLGGLIDYEWKEPYFQLPDDIINELNRTLSILYPHLYLDLEQTFHNLPTEVESERTLHEYDKFAHKCQKKCVHDWNKVPDINIYDEQMDSSYVEHCGKCHFTAPRKQRTF